MTAAVLERAAPADRNAPRQLGQLPPQQRAATIVPATFNREARTVEVVWTTGSRRRAYDWWNDTMYEEELIVSEDAVDMSRFEAGAVQVLDGHNVYGGVASILGIAQRGWIAGGEGRALLRLSEREELAGIVRDIEIGVIRTISFGYSVERYEITRAQDRTDGVNLPLYRAARWTPQEISFVTVPADPNAQTRAAGGQPHGQAQATAQPGATPSHSPTPAPVAGLPCEFIRAAAHHAPQESSMPQTIDTTAGGATAAPANTTTTTAATEPATATRAAADDTAAHQRAAADAATARAAEITELCTRHQVGQLAVGLIRSGASVEAAQKAILDEMAHRDAASGGHLNVRNITTVTDELQTRMDGMQEALLTRVDGRAKLTDNGRRFRGMSLLEICRDILEVGGVNTRGMDRLQLATRGMQYRSGGMHTTSDFGSIMANVASKRLRNAYEENPGTYTQWARRAPNAPDFKSMSIVQLSAMPDLLQVNEHGEFKYGSISDGAESYALLTYGRIVSLTRQAIINDDLRAFDRLVSGFGASAARLENRLVYSQLTANAAMADTVALFHATHGNLQTGAGSALQFSALTTARTAMRSQKGLQNEELNLAPSTLIVPAALEQTAYQLTSSQYTPAVQSNVNEFRQGGRTALNPVVEPILDANSATAWYLTASNSQVDTVEYCYLDGAEGPIVESEMGFEVDGLSIKCREDFAAKAIDWRGLYKSAGA